MLKMKNLIKIALVLGMFHSSMYSQDRDPAGHLKTLMRDTDKVEIAYCGLGGRIRLEEELKNGWVLKYAVYMRDTNSIVLEYENYSKPGRDGIYSSRINDPYGLRKEEIYGSPEKYEEIRKGTVQRLTDYLED